MWCRITGTPGGGPRQKCLCWFNILVNKSFCKYRRIKHKAVFIITDKLAKREVWISNPSAEVLTLRSSLTALWK